MRIALNQDVNILKSERYGKIKSVKVIAGDSVAVVDQLLNIL